MAYAGASSPLRCVSLQQAFSPDFPAGTGPYVVHWCAGPAVQCMGNAGHKQALHAVHLRVRRASSVKEAWAVDLKALRKKLTDESDEDESDGAKDNTKEKVRELRERLLLHKLDDPKLSAADRLNFAVAVECMKAKKKKRDKSPKRDRSRRRRKKRRSRGRDGSTSTDSSPSDKGLFRVGSSLSGGSRSRIQKIADDEPGELYSQAVGDINGFLGARGAAFRGAKSSESWMTYLQAVVFAQHPPSSLPPEKVRELEAKAKALDRLGSGALKGTADQLTQEFKALELELAGRKDIAEELQLVGLEDKMLVSKAELASAQRSRAWKQKLDRGR